MPDAGSAPGCRLSERLERLAGRTPVVASREHLLEPHVEDDEEVAAAHLLERELGGGQPLPLHRPLRVAREGDRKSTRLNSSHLVISYAVFCLKKKNKRYTEYFR